MFVVAYALSPIDLIPDFIPVLGYIDDVLLPGVIYLAIRLLPPDILVESRRQAEGLDKLGRLKAPQHERCSADHRDVGGHWTDSVVWFMPRSMNGSAGRGRGARPSASSICHFT